MLGGVPLAFLDVLGRPVVHRMANLLQEQGVSRVSILSEYPMPAMSSAGRAVQAAIGCEHLAPARFWRGAENAFSDLVQAGADEVIVIRLGGYIQLDVQDLLSHHFEKRCRVTAAVTPDGKPLEVFSISANRRNDAAFLFRHQLQETRTPCQNYVFHGYVNRLETASDLRALAVEALLQRIPIQPEGKEIRPGIWVAEGARIHPTARLVAPAFVGERARVLERAVVTRCSAVEHHAVVAPGTVVEGATVLPHTRVGAALDLAHTVAGLGRVINLRRAVEVEVEDPRLLSAISPHAPVRVVGGVLSLTTFLPLQFLRGLFASSHREPVVVPPAVSAAGAHRAARSVPEPAPVSDEFPVNIAVARRYGNE